MSMVAITISRYRLQREGGWVPLLLWIVLFEPPTPPTFSECGISLFSLRMRKTVIFVSHTPRYECILAMCFIGPESGLRCSHLCRKKEGCAFVFVKQCFLVCGFHGFRLRRCFYFSDFYVSRTRSMFKSEFGVCVCLERQVASAFYVMRILEGSAVFTFREIKTCDLQTLPRLCFESERDKKERLTSISLLDVCFVSSCRIAEFSFFCPMDICAQWQRLFHVFSWRAFCVSGVWRLIPVIWFTGYRYNTYTWYVK